MPATKYSFGPFLLDIAQRSLSRDGLRLSLTPKAFDVLHVLVEHCGHVVSKDQLLQQVWPDTFVEEATLAQNISALRRALGETRTGPVYIQTVPKYGYRFAANVREEGPTKKAELAHLAIVLPPSTLAWCARGPALCLSPEGSRVVYVGRERGSLQLFARELHDSKPRPIEGTQGASCPFFSPDGEWIGFFAEGKLRRVAAGGGRRLDLCDAPDGRGACWGTKEIIVFAPTPAGGLWRVAATGGGSPQPLTTPDRSRDEVTHRWPEFLPDGETVLFTIGLQGSESYDDARIAYGRLDKTGHHTLIHGGTNARYLTTGHVAFCRAGTLIAAPFSARQMSILSHPLPVLDHVLTEETGAAQWAVSSNGMLVYISGDRRATQRVLAFAGADSSIRSLPLRSARFEEPRLSPDGTRLALGIRGKTSDIWVADVATGAMARLTEEADNFAPIWRPDGRGIIFSSNRLGPCNVFDINLEGDREPELMISSEFDQVASSFSFDSNLLAITEYHPSSGADILIADLRNRPATLHALARTRANEWGAVFSPDGKSVAYASDQSGRAEIYVQGLSERVNQQVSFDGGSEPLWSSNGDRVYFRNPHGIWSVSVGTFGVTGPTSAKLVLPLRSLTGGTAYLPNYDVSRAAPDEFLVIQEFDQEPTVERLQVVLGWSRYIRQQWDATSEHI